MFLVNEISISPNDRYIAIVSVGEGHLVLQIFDLKEILNSYEYYEEKKFTQIGFINPYPGYISIESWRGENIIVSSDIPLNISDKTKMLESGDEAKYEWNFRKNKIKKRD